MYRLGDSLAHSSHLKSITLEAHWCWSSVRMWFLILCVAFKLCYSGAPAYIVHTLEPSTKAMPLVHVHPNVRICVAWCISLVEYMSTTVLTTHTVPHRIEHPLLQCAHLLHPCVRFGWLRSAHIARRSSVCPHTRTCSSIASCVCVASRFATLVASVACKPMSHHSEEEIPATKAVAKARFGTPYLAHMPLDCLVRDICAVWGLIGVVEKEKQCRSGI